MKSILVLMFLLLSFSAQAFEADYTYDCEMFVKEPESEFKKEKEEFTLEIGLSSGFLGWGPGWMSLKNQSTGSFVRLSLGECAGTSDTGFFLIDDRCTRIYVEDEYGYFYKGNSYTTSEIDGLPGWVNTNLKMSYSALKGAPTAVVSIAEYGGETADGNVRVYYTEWRCQR